MQAVRGIWVTHKWNAVRFWYHSFTTFFLFRWLCHTMQDQRPPTEWMRQASCARCHSESSERSVYKKSFSSKCTHLKNVVFVVFPCLRHDFRTGIPEIGIPALDPAKVSKLELARDGPLTMTLVFSNSTHFGLGDLKVESARWVSNRPVTKLN